MTPTGQLSGSENIETYPYLSVVSDPDTKVQG
jgi:hypothetical protein